MGMNPAPQIETFAAAENHQWLASEHGTQNAHPGTLDGAAFADAFEDGVVPSGTCVALNTSGASVGLWGPFDADSTTGLDVDASALFTTTVLNGGDGDTPTAILMHGHIRVSKLPEDSGWNEDSIAAAAGRFVFQLT